MWIRSQNRNILVNADKFSVSKEHEVFRIYSVNSFLGEYSTEKKAMKVMDGIQNCLCRGTKSYHPVEPLSVINGFPPYKIEREHVFQMPKDDEVDL